MRLGQGQLGIFHSGNLSLLSTPKMSRLRSLTTLANKQADNTTCQSQQPKSWLHSERLRLLLRLRPLTDTTEEAIAKRRLYKERCRKYERLVAKTKNLKDALDMSHFATARLRDICDALNPEMQSTVDFATSNPPKRSSTKPPEDPTAAAIDHELDYIEWRLFDVETHNHTLFGTLRSVTKFLVSQRTLNSKDTATLRDDDVFYRLDDEHSFSLYDSRIGIRCGGWRRGAPAGIQLNPQHVEDQLRESKTSPPLISVADHPGIYINPSMSKPDPLHRLR